jgi:hypothetical protein
MAPVSDLELRAAINNSPSQKTLVLLLFHMNGLNFYLLMGFLIFVD